MARKTSTVPTKIYTYGCFAPLEGEPERERFLNQYRLARVYKNQLIEIELRRLAAVREALAAAPDVVPFKAKVEALETELEGIRTQIKGARQRARKRVDTAALDARAKAIVVELKKARAELKEVRKKVDDPVTKDKIALTNTDAFNAVKMARADIVKNGIYWGNYLFIEAETEQARKSGRDPRFRRWDGRGRVGVQCQGGLSVSKLFGDNTLIRISPKPLTDKLGERRRLVELRVGSDAKGHPIFVKFQMILHRPMPVDAEIKWAWVRRVKIATHDRYELQFVLESKTFVPPTEAEGTGLAAIDIGWRRQGDSLRYAYLHDGTTSRELKLPAGIPSKLAHADSLRAIRDREFNKIKERVMAWCQEAPTMPEWLSTELTYLHQWRSSQRLYQLFWRWHKERFEGDAEIFGELDVWRKQEHHLHLWEDNERDKALGWRKDFYRNEAVRIARTYAKVALEKFDLSKVARLPQAEGKETLTEGSRRNRFLTGLSEFRRYLIEALRGRGGEEVMVPAEMSTIECHKCGHSVLWDKAPSIFHTCGGCGARWDQDENAAINLYWRASDEMPPTPADLPTEGNGLENSVETTGRRSVRGSSLDDGGQALETV